jgi:GT2 family glycosyltransferase
MVTVTYGNRWLYLSQLLTYAEKTQLIDEVVLVDNGSKYCVCKNVESSGFKKAFVLELGENRGSAEGFGVGISSAISRSADFIWLLDDDNLPNEGALDELMQCHERLIDDKECAAINYGVGVLALRPDRNEFVRAIKERNSISVVRNSFMGLDVFSKLIRLPKRELYNRCNQFIMRNPSCVFVDYAPYGGLLLPTDTIKKMGLPEKCFETYADDYEYSYRITREGGLIVLCGNALVNDLETSWNRRKSSTHRLLSEESSENKIYLSVRNQVCWELCNFVTNRVLYSFNIFAYLTGLLVKGLLDGVPMIALSRRIILIMRSIRDGVNLVRIVGRSEKHC